MSETTPDTPTVHAAWAAVMADVRAVGKDDVNQHQRFNFRGIDAVMNAVGPALRRHGVSVVPSMVETANRDVTTTQNKASREATVRVTYTVFGPGGDSFTGMAPGEAMDAGDKGTPKAMSVALRTFLLQALCLPTQEADPDEETYERAAGPSPQELAQNTADRVAAEPSSVPQLHRVEQWAAANDLLGVHVTTPSGESWTLARVLTVATEQARQRAEQAATEQPAEQGSTGEAAA